MELDEPEMLVVKYKDLIIGPVRLSSLAYKDMKRIKPNVRWRMKESFMMPKIKPLIRIGDTLYIPEEIL